MPADERIQVREVPPTEADACPPEGFPATETEWLDYECRARNNAILLINEWLEHGNSARVDELEELVEEDAFAAAWHRHPIEEYDDGNQVWDMWRGFVVWRRDELESQAGEDLIMRLACEGWLEIDTRRWPWLKLTNGEPIARTESVRPSLEDGLSGADATETDITRKPSPQERER